MDMASKIGFQTGKGVWYGPEIKKREKDWVFHLTDLELKELEVAADIIVASSPNNSNCLHLGVLDSLENFNLTNVNKKVELFSKQLEEGLGFLLWRGLPLKTWNYKRIAAAFLVIGRCFGNLRQQNAKGHVLGGWCT